MSRHLLICGLLLLALGSFCGRTATGQDAILERQATTMTVRVIDGTTGEPARADRVLIREMGAVMTVMADGGPVDGEITFEDLQAFNFKPYIVTAWVDGVAYHAKQTGQAFLDGKPLVVYSFSQTDDLAGLSITGMNVVVRLREGGFELEYIVTVDNQSRPQRTMRAEALPVRLRLPAGMRSVTVDVDRGPDPLTADLRAATGGLHGIAVALPPGEARISVKGLLSAPDRVDLVVAANLPVASWSLLAWPADIVIRSFDLERDHGSAYTEFSRWLGEPLAPGEEVEVSVGAPPPEDVQSAFQAEDESAPAEHARPRPERRRTPWLTIGAAILLLGAYGFWRFRR